MVCEREKCVCGGRGEEKCKLGYGGGTLEGERPV
jgi:hypothetical protein